jgi:hypothetical protein
MKRAVWLRHLLRPMIRKGVVHAIGGVGKRLAELLIEVSSGVIDDGDKKDDHEENGDKWKHGSGETNDGPHRTEENHGDEW